MGGNSDLFEDLREHILDSMWKDQIGMQGPRMRLRLKRFLRKLGIKSYKHL